MKRIALLLTAIALTCASANAQSLLERLGQRAKNAAENNVGNKVEQGVNDLLNGKLGKKKDKKDQKQETAQPAQTALPQDGTWTCPNPECGHAGNTGKFCEECGTKKPEGAAPVSAKQGAQISWNNYDFVSGDEIIFEDTMEGEQMGEFPSQWDAFRGTAQIVEMDGVKAINYQDADITPLFNDGKPYLTEECTIEFDLYLWDFAIKDRTRQYGGIYYEVCLGYGDKIKDVDSGGSALFFRIPQAEDNYNEISYQWHSPAGDRREGKFVVENVTRPAWHHIAVSFNKRAYKIYFDEQRVASIPNAAAPGFLVLKSINYQQMYFVKNVRIAKGAVPLYDRLASDGKIVTYAITFDTGKATIKPESTGEINRIKGIMDQDPSLKFEVQGHCDNTGSDAVNDPLSQKRAEAIVARLVELGISADRLTAVGKGSHEPIADNSSDEGRAKNRRVVFVKK
ncbi:MAG: OmpA family protein [Bacteroidales bacterium]|nr:OmpA family protein [Bacteroidales bacterium]